MRLRHPALDPPGTSFNIYYFQEASALLLPRRIATLHNARITGVAFARRPPRAKVNMVDTRVLATAGTQHIRNVVSASWLYPFKGIYYFCTHPAYYSLFGRRLVPLTIVSIIVLGLLFTFTYLPQVAFLAIFHGHLAWFNAAFLVLGEGQVVIALLFEALMVDETLVDVFDVIYSSFESTFDALLTRLVA